MNILNLENAPIDELERILWLSGVKAQALKELNEEFASAYYDARLCGRFNAAVGLGIHSKKSALAFTRHRNNSNGRMLRWGDQIDQSSSAYDPSV